MFFEKMAQLAQYFFENLNFFRYSRAALDPLAGLLFETTELEVSTHFYVVRRLPVMSQSFYASKFQKA